ncbi:MAG: CopG family transcriptional regulator [Chloroflexota bacterium]|nr:CopG family transcriptional regulator [Chloroflexota bacterium]
MHRTTVMIPDDLVEKLRLLAYERRTSMGSIIREALEDKAKAGHPRPTCLGIGASGFTDTARRTGEERAQPRPWH